MVYFRVINTAHRLSVFPGICSLVIRQNYTMHNRTSIRRSNHTSWRGNRLQTQHQNRLSRNYRQKQQSIQADRYVNVAAPQKQPSENQIQHRFTDFGFAASILNNITARGYTAPTPIQDRAIGPALSGKDVVGIANTGTGKTAAFLLPLIQAYLTNKQTRALIMCPTRELAVQITDELKAFTRQTDIRQAVCIGGASMYNQIADLRRQPTFVIGTPGRLKDLIARRALYTGQFTHVVLDEVDRMVDIGFLKDIRYLLSLLPRNRQSLFFSATITPDVAGIMQQFLTNPVTISVKTHDTAQTVDQDVVKVADPSKKFDALLDLLCQAEFQKVLIFGRTKWGVEKLAKNLDSRGFRTAAIHGNKSQNQRQTALDRFKKDYLQILVATDIAARGLDIPDVSHVINYDEPATYEDYVHRIGRTGRAEKRGKALTFVI